MSSGGGIRTRDLRVMRSGCRRRPGWSRLQKAYKQRPGAATFAQFGTPSGTTGTRPPCRLVFAARAAGTATTTGDPTATGDTARRHGRSAPHPTRHLRTAAGQDREPAQRLPVPLELAGTERGISLQLEPDSKGGIRAGTEEQLDVNAVEPVRATLGLDLQGLELPGREIILVSAVAGPLRRALDEGLRELRCGFEGGGERLR